LCIVNDAAAFFAQARIAEAVEHVRIVIIVSGDVSSEALTRNRSRTPTLVKVDCGTRHAEERAVRDRCTVREREAILGDYSARHND
jgi:hypothetical protein